MTTTTLARVILSYPTLLSLAGAAAAEGRAPRSWIQLARTGSFESQRYGAFSITPADLASMKRNFDTITPAAPTELPVDYDHLSMAPTKPGDGVAAGWIKQVELRSDGNELWGLVEWTPTAAKQIAEHEYRFVSPSFVKDHQHKDGQNIGTTLIAAAITNHPFLEGMQALTLYDACAMGDLAVSARPDEVSHAALSAVGAQAAAGAGTKPTIARGEWQANNQEEAAVQTHTLVKAAAFVERVTSLSRALPPAEALRRAQVEDPCGAKAYRLRGIGTDEVPADEPTVNLSIRQGDDFDTAVRRYAEQEGVALRDAICHVGKYWHRQGACERER